MGLTGKRMKIIIRWFITAQSVTPEDILGALVILPIRDPVISFRELTSLRRPARRNAKSLILSILSFLKSISWVLRNSVLLSRRQNTIDSSCSMIVREAFVKMVLAILPLPEI